jgi:CheY-like chemotaxis protein
LSTDSERLRAAAWHGKDRIFFRVNEYTNRRDGIVATVLIVDDEAPIRRALLRIIEALGHSVLEACDGVDALKMLGNHGVDLAIVDLMMPRMGGLELMSSMRVEYPGTKVIVISAFEEIIDLAERERDVVMTLKKPFEPSEVAKALRKALGEN